MQPVFKTPTRELLLQKGDSQVLKDITRLRLRDLGLRQIEGLYQLRALKQLDLGFNQIAEIRGLNECRALESLDLQSNSIQAIEGLSHCKFVSRLNLAGNLISRMSGIEQLKKLKYLNLSRNKIQRVGYLDFLMGLEELHLAHNQIRAVDRPLNLLKSIQVVDLSHNLIQVLDSKTFQNMSAMSELNLEGNRLRGGLEFLAVLSELTTLNLSQNRIEMLALPLLPHLMQLKVSHNQITSIEGLHTSCPEVSCLDVSFNFLPSSFCLIEEIALMAELNQLDFRHNPISSEQLEQSVFKLYRYDFINGKAWQESGTNFARKFDQVAAQMIADKEIYQFSEYDVLKLKEKLVEEAQLEQEGESRQPALKCMEQYQYEQFIAHTQSKLNEMKMLYQARLQANRTAFLTGIKPEGEAQSTTPQEEPEQQTSREVQRQHKAPLPKRISFSSTLKMPPKPNELPAVQQQKYRNMLSAYEKQWRQMKEGEEQKQKQFKIRKQGGTRQLSATLKQEPPSRSRPKMFSPMKRIV